MHALGKGNRSPAPSLLINILVLSDVVIFLQESNQKYNFVTPEGKSGVVPVHSLIAREKPGQDNKALYLISTSDREPEMYELHAEKAKKGKRAGLPMPRKIKVKFQKS